jgi:hypothetical protein
MGEVKFVKLPPFLRQIGVDQIPTKVIEEGYNPHQGPQVIAVGTEEDLSAFRSSSQIDPETHPIHPARLGTHIDFYGHEAKELIAKKPMSDIRSLRSKK